MKKQQQYAIGAGLAVLTLGYFLTRKKSAPLFITSGGTYDAQAGQTFQVRLPHGQYVMMGGDGLTLLAQSPTGDMQDLQILVNDSPLPFTVTPTFIDEGDDTNQHTVTVKVAATIEG